MVSKAKNKAASSCLTTPSSAPKKPNPRRLWWKKFVDSPRKLSNLRPSASTLLVSSHPAAAQSEHTPSSSSSAQPVAERHVLFATDTLLADEACDEEILPCELSSDGRLPELNRMDSDAHLRMLKRWQQTLADYVFAYKAIALGGIMFGERPSKLPPIRQYKLKTLLAGSAASSAKSLGCNLGSSASLSQDTTPGRGTLNAGLDSSLSQLVPSSPEPALEDGEESAIHLANAATQLLVHNDSIRSLQSESAVKSSGSSTVDDLSPARPPISAPIGKPCSPKARKLKTLIQEASEISEDSPKKFIDISSASEVSPLVISRGKLVNPERNQAASGISDGTQPILRNSSKRCHQTAPSRLNRTVSHHAVFSDAADDDRNEDAHVQSPVFVKDRPKHHTTKDIGLLKGRSQPMFQGHKCRGSRGHTDADFALMAQLSREYNMVIDELLESHRYFAECDTSRKGEISCEAFEDLIRSRCNLPADKPVPFHLTERVQAEGKKVLKFEDFLKWSVHCAYMEELMVPDPNDRHVRMLAREHGMLLLDVEKIKDVFDGFDTDGSGEIEEDEFKHILYRLMNVKNEADVSEKRLERYWRELDADGSGSVIFDEFLTWYARLFPGDTGGTSGS